MAEEVGAGLMQQSGQDLASSKRILYMYCAGGGKSWLCGTYQARRVEKRSFSKVSRFDGGHHRLHDVKTYNISRSLHSPRAHVCASCDIMSSPSEHGVDLLITTYGPQPAVWTCSVA